MDEPPTQEQQILLNQAAAAIMRELQMELTTTRAERDRWLARNRELEARIDQIREIVK